MYFRGVNPVKAFIKDPIFSYYYFITFEFVYYFVIE